MEPMSRPCTPITLSRAEEAELNKLIRAPRTQRRHADRARIVLEAFHGKSNIEIAALMRTRPATISKWRIRFEQEGLMVLPVTIIAGDFFMIICGDEG
jgi:hypothetical protein